MAKEKTRKIAENDAISGLNIVLTSIIIQLISDDRTVGAYIYKLEMYDI